MKKRFAGVLAALMVLVMGTTTVFAAGSPSANDAVVDALNKGVTSVTQKNGSSTQIISTGKVAKADYQAADQNKQNTYDSIVAMTDIVGISVPSGQSATVTIAVDGIRQGDKVYVLHKYKVGGTYMWERLTPDAVGNGYVTVTMKSFSPVFVVKVGEAPSNGNGSNNGGTNNGGTNNGSNNGTNTTPPTNGNNNNNTTGDSTSQSNNNNQSNSQTNNQNNPVNVDQTVNVTYPDMDDRYDEGYEAGYNAAMSTNKGSTGSGNSGSGSSGSSAGGAATVVSPKTGASLPALPFVAMFAAAGIAVCGKKARNRDRKSTRLNSSH